MSDSPAAILHNTSGTEIATASNPVRTDPTGSTAQPVTQNTASNLKTQVDGQGTAGSPVGGVVSVQGVASGTVLPVSDGGGTLTVDGAVTANIGTSGSLALDATLTGGTQKAIVRGGAKGATTAADVTSTAEGADHQALDVQIYHGGTAKDPTQVRALTSADVVTAAQGTAAAASGGWPVKATDGTNTAAVKAASTAAVAGDPALVVALSPNNSPGNKTNNNAAPGANNLGALVALANAAAPTWTEGNLVLLSTLLNGALRTDNTTWLGSAAPTVGQKTMANSLPVAIASDQNTAANAATLANVAGSAASVTLLAANTARISATIFNDSTSILYVKFGTTASTSSFTVRLVPNAYYEVPVGRDGKIYNGRIDGIWASATGNARVTEVA